MAHVTGNSRITSIHEVSVICRGTLSGSTISTDGNPYYLSKSSQYLLGSLYIHVTGNDYYMWASGDSDDNRYHQRPKVATGLRANMTLVFYPGFLKSDRYLLRSLYIHVTGSSKITSVHESTIRACGILYGAQIVSNGHGESLKAIQYLLKILYIHTCNR